MAQSAANSGLESLAAEASRRAESMEAQAEAGPSTEANGSKSASQSSGQKGKVRKAYTITKQRERWTDSEHERFLQALKRYGRAWRKIEEHIGTKTAVQIRSHAQKFFSKLQREQSANGGTGEESSKGGISIPPPRPKRKPMHPYPRKNGDSTTADGSSQQPQPAPKQPGPVPTPAAPVIAPLPVLDARGGEVSLSQVLETAAMAAANAWSQVVASAGSKVQQQLQQGLQSMQPLLGVSPTLLYQMAAQQQQQQPPLAANLQSSSQHPMGRSPFLNSSNPDSNLPTASAAPHPQAQAQSMQDSPDGAGNAADQGNDRDSACSKEYNRGQLNSGIDHGLSSGRQTLPRSWGGMPQEQQQLPDRRLSRAAWELMTQTQAANAAAQQWADPLRLASLARLPSRAFSAGPILHIGGTAKQVKQEAAQPSVKGGEPGSSLHKAAQSHSDTSQLARYYQQAAAEEQQAAQDADNVENGSSGEGGGSSGDGSNGKLGLPRSDKGSNTGNSGSDEDAHGNGSGSRSDVGVNDPADANGNDGKGSDEGSNSPRGFTRNNSPLATDPPPKPVPVNSKLQKPGLFVLGNGIDQARMAAATAQLQHQLPPPLPQLPPPPAPVAPKLPGPALSALQQQALNAWATSIQQQPGAVHNGYQLLQGLISNMQANSRVNNQPIPAATSPGLKPAGDASMGDRKSSGAPSMDTFNANSSRSFSVPPGVANGSVCSQEGINGSIAEAGSGFKPYNKRHGMPGMALPPSKRFAYGTDKPKPVAGQAALAGSPRANAGYVQPGVYSPFGSFADRTRKL